MEQKGSNAETKRLNKIKIAKYIYHHGDTSKQELADRLNLSMPTVLQRVRELLQEGIIAETGEYESTGGRKARILSIAAKNRYAAGLDITKNHVSFVLLDAGGNVCGKKRVRCAFENCEEYYGGLGQMLSLFLEKCHVDREKILGVGISVPGIVDEEKQRLTQSHVLKVEDLELDRISRHIPWRIRFQNDANSAAYAELRGSKRDTLYLSLSNTVGGAIYMNGEIYKGDHFRSAEFGHMILVPGGKRCYCGREGCMDAYCAAGVLSRWAGDDLDAFFYGMGANPDCQAVWHEYLNSLAIALTNLQMAFDCDVILGGYVGGYMDQYMEALEARLSEYRIFGSGQNHVRTGSYKHEAAAIGVGIRFVEEYFDGIV